MIVLTAFIKRQITHSTRQASVFVLCVALSMITLIALNGFSESVHQSLLKDARSLHGGDIIVHSHSPLSRSLSEAIKALEERGAVERVRTYDFYSVVRTPAGDTSLLANLKVVAEGYPLYGMVELKSGQSLREVLKPGTIVVEQTLLDRLGMAVGDRLRVGAATLSVADVVIHEPDRPVSFFSLGPRVLVGAGDLDSLDLLKEGSRVQYNQLLKVRDMTGVNAIFEQLRTLAASEHERVETSQTAESGVKRFFDNFLFFLRLIGLFTLLLSGIGIQSALAAYLQENEQTIAIMKTVGAKNSLIAFQFILVLMTLGAVGSFMGLCLGLGLQNTLPMLFQDLLPTGGAPVVSWRTIFEGIALGSFVVLLFTVLPLFRLKEFTPGILLRKEGLRGKRTWAYILTTGAIFLFFTGMVFWQLMDLKTGLWFVLGVVTLILSATLVTQITLVFLKKCRFRSLALRQARRGLFRPRNATRSIIVTLTASLSLIFSLHLVEQNLDATFVHSYPPDVPNVFFLDIQPGQIGEFSEAFGGERPQYHPVVRGRLTAINGAPIDGDQERRRKGDNLVREFSLTYRGHLIEGETLVTGDGLFRDEWGEDQVSVLDTVVKMRDMKVGDRLTFRIQGLPVEARISSIRTRSRHLIQPFFYFVFPEKRLKDAPQTLFTATRVQKEGIAALQNRIVSQFPNVTVIDVTETISVFSKVMHKLSGITRVFTLFSMLAGVLLIIGSVFATRFARVQEAVYYKILGAKSVFVLKVFTLENAFLGTISALPALAISQTAGWIITVRALDVPYHPFLGTCLLMALGTVVLVVGVGLLSSVSILRQKPVSFLRDQAS